METFVSLSKQAVLNGLEHYRAIAKHDLLCAPNMSNPDTYRTHAEVRRQVYAELATNIEKQGIQHTVQLALERYERLPLVAGTPDHTCTAIKAEESALENFFLMIGLNNKTRREARSRRPTLDEETALLRTHSKRSGGLANARA